MRFHEVRTKSALNHIPGGARLPFEWTVNPYRGCTPRLRLLLRPPDARVPGPGRGARTSSARSSSRSTCPRCCAPSSRGRRGGASAVALGTNTDPYQWVEGRYKLMRGIWEALRDAANPCSILTKSPLLLRDLDLLKEIARGDGGERVPVGADAGREGVAGDRAAHAEPAGAARGGGGAQPRRASRPAC